MYLCPIQNHLKATSLVAFKTKQEYVPYEVFGL